MIKLVKWAYARGKEHERMRIKTLLTKWSANRQNETRNFSTGDKTEQLLAQGAALDLIARLMQPDYAPISREMPAPIDDEEAA